TPNLNLLSPLRTLKPPFPFEYGVTANNILSILRSTSLWKASGFDGLPIGFLKALGLPFCKVFAIIGEASLRIGYFPTSFKRAIVIVLPKPGKTPAEKE